MDYKIDEMRYKDWKRVSQIYKDGIKLHNISPQ